MDFTKLIGILFLMINSFTLLRLQNSGGELFVSNLSVNSQSLMVVTWFTAGMSLFFFSMGFNNLIAWYSNVGRDGSQWNYLVDRINTLLGPVIVWIFSSTIVLNILSRSENFPNYLTTSEDGVMSSIEFILWPLWLVSIYLVMVLFAPFTIYLHKKYPYATLLSLIKKVYVNKVQTQKSSGKGVLFCILHNLIWKIKYQILRKTHFLLF